MLSKKYFDTYSIWKLVKDDKSHRLAAENLLQSQSKKIERGDHAWSPDSDGIIESRKDVVERNSKREFSEEYAQLGNKEVFFPIENCFTFYKLKHI